ncbi:TetR/AcrR family transcriptional regulator [Microbacterium hominis]|uniref:TetR/AcrR family transcriptional regulator n=1 Tax=Microbacterium hominis TaxID=162426 RepID=A0A7D4TH01_9MICO|nr:TetR/AcrR family transcriptional regulator [Microbacterium hominis]QKJ19741.1 TetR/AcrR family transcriptional regulator [Microbacterium hominis]
MSRKVPYGGGRDLLVASTVEIVAERGLRGLTFRAVAERAGVNNSLVAHHFGTREALLAAALEWAVERSIESTGLLSMSSEEKFVDNLVDSITTQPELQTFQYEMILEARRNELFREPVTLLYDRYQAVLADSLKRFGIEGDVSALSRQVFAALDGLVLQYIAGVHPAELRDAVHDIWLMLQLRRDVGIPTTSRASGGVE